MANSVWARLTEFEDGADGAGWVVWSGFGTLGGSGGEEITGGAVEVVGVELSGLGMAVTFRSRAASRYLSSWISRRRSWRVGSFTALKMETPGATGSLRGPFLGLCLIGR